MDKYNLQIIPPHSGKVKRFSVSDKRLKWILSGVGLFLLVNLLVFGFNIFLWAKHSRNSASKVNIEKLAQQLEFNEILAESLKTTLSEYSALSKDVRDFADLPPIPAEKFSYGIGGPQLPSDSEHLLMAKSRNITYKLDSLINAAKTERAALIETREVFEANKKRYANTPSISPMQGYISSGFGKRLDPFTGVWKMHEGIDICARKGTPVYATADGRVSFAGWYHGYGKMIKLSHLGYETRYGHLNDISVKPGERVQRGEQIGTCGNTGYTTGVHLHYEVRLGGRPVDPKQYIYPDVVLD